MKTPAPATGATSTITGADSAHGLPPGTVLAQRYRIEGLLGIGGMGMVYRATDLSLGVDVALKLLRPELSTRGEAFERFRQELLLARQVSSPHVLRIHDMARDGEHWFISMDFVDGEPLDRLLDREGALPLERALAITAQIASGLAAAHAQNVVHRDLKPSNVLIDARGQAVIADFGVARSLGSTGLTHTGAIVGTPDYLSPEQARGARIDARSDLYTLGLLLYEMLSGQLPHAGCTASEAVSQRMSGHLPPIERKRRDLPAWVARLVARMLRPTPAHRFQTAEQVIAAIANRRVTRDWRPWLRPALFATAAAALLATLWWWWPAGMSGPMPVPPPDRLLLLPIEFDEPDLPRPALTALAEHMRRALAASGGPAIVDGERTAQALTRLGLAEGDPVSDQLLLHDVPAEGSLRLVLHAAPDGRFSMQGEWREHGQPPRLADSGRQPGLIEAAEALLPQLRAQYGAAPVVIGHGVLPAGVDALARYGEGLRLRRLGQLEHALREFEAATVLEPDYASAWLAAAEVARLAGAPERMRTAISRGRALPSPMLAGEFALLAELDANDWAAAGQRLERRIAAAPDDFASRLMLADVLAERGEYPAVEALLADLVDRDPGEARGWFLRGKNAILRGLVQPAVDDYLVRAVLLFKRYRNRFGEAEAVNALGVGFARLGQIGDADEQYRKALELREAIGHRRGVASSLRNLAQLATIRGDLVEAEQLLDRARKLFADLGDRAGLAAVDNEIGLLAEERGDYVRALEAFRLALRGREALSDRRGGAESLNNIGFAHYQLGDYDSAQVFWRQANEAFVQLGDLNGVVRTSQNLGLLDTVRGRWDDAEQRLLQSLATAEQQHMAEEAAVSRRNLAELALLRGELSAALDHIDRAGRLFEERQDQRGLIDVMLLRARLLLAAGAGQRAREVSAAVDAVLPGASVEQRALGALLRTELAQAQRDPVAERMALADARRHAVSSGGRALLLWIELLGGRRDAALGGELQVLGHRPLWLLWAELALAARLDGAVDGEPVELYLQVLERVADGGGRYRRAWQLHRLGERALQAAGLNEDAATAAAAAAAALAELQQNTPVELLWALDTESEGDRR